jgi:hypothetical protein
MRFRAITVVLGIGLACGIGASACSAPDPGAVTFVPRNHPAPAASSGSGASSSGAISGDAGSSVDAGHDSGPPNAFTSKPAFTAGTAVQSSTQDQHNAQFGSTNPTGRNCMDCHKNGGLSPEMSIGGGAVTAGGTPAAGLEVRVVDAKTGAEVADAFTDENGNFYVNSTALTGTYRVGVRSKQKTSLMTDTVPNGACNTAACHGQGSTQGPITL